MDNTGDDIERFLLIGQLIFKELEGEPLSMTEQEELLRWRCSSDNANAIYNGLKNRKGVVKSLTVLNERYRTAQAMRKVFATLGIDPVAKQRRRRKLWKGGVTIATAVVILFFAGRILLSNDNGQELPTTQVKTRTAKKIVDTDRNKVTLTLGDGSEVRLDSAGNGELARQGDASVIKSNNGLIYQGDRSYQKIVYNTLSTSRGGQYQVILPDGSKVWLNAASSLTYPTTFSEKERVVQLNGEAYFEVEHNKMKPFFVRTASMEVKVLGTHFDVMAYQDENHHQATLLEGKVEVRSSGNQLTIDPGQQAEVTKGGGSILIDKEVDIDKVMAWRYGFFKFDDSDIRSIMREVARWYDIDVEYKTSDLSGHFGGRIDKSIPLAELVKLLEGNGIYHYRIEGRKLFVLP